MAEQFEERVLGMLDALSVGLVSMRDELREEIGGLRSEMREGFDRVERRLGNVENRVEAFERRITALGG